MKATRYISLVFLLVASTAFAQHWGTFPDGGTLTFYTNTIGTDGAPETPASEAIAAYDATDTQTAGAHVAIDDDVDLLTGFHRITIDTTNAFFVQGGFYTIVYTAGTSDAISLTGRTIGTFRLGGAEITAGYSPVTIKDGTGTGELDTTGGAVATVNSINTGGIQPASFSGGGIDSTFFLAGAIDATAIAANAIGASELATGAIGNDEFNVTETLAANPASGGIVAASFGAGAIDNAAFNVTETLTANPATGGIVAGSFGAGAIDSAAVGTGAIDADAIAADAIGASEVAVDALGASELAADAIGASEIGTAAIQAAELDVTGSEFTAIPWNAAYDAEVQSEVDDALVVHRLDELLNADSDIDGAAPPTVGSVFHEALTKTAGSFTYDQTTDALEAIRDRGDAAWTGGGGAASNPQHLQETTITGLSTQKVFNLTAGSADNDAYNGALAVIVDASTSTQKGFELIKDYVGSTRTVMLRATPVFTIANGDTIHIIATDSKPLSLELVPAVRTWRFDTRNQLTASNDITIAAGDDMTVAMDLTNCMHAADSIDTVDSVTIADVVGETEPILGTSEKDSTAKKVNIPVNAALATGATYTVTVTATSVDGQQIIRMGRLVVQE